MNDADDIDDDLTSSCNEDGPIFNTLPDQSIPFLMQEILEKECTFLFMFICREGRWGRLITVNLIKGIEN